MQFKNFLRMQFKRGHFIAEWSSVASQYSEIFGVGAALKYLKQIITVFFFIFAHALKNFGACTEHRLPVVTNKGGFLVAFVCDC